MALAALLLERLAVVVAAALAEAQRGIMAAAAASPTGAKMLWTDVPILSGLPAEATSTTSCSRRRGT